MNAVYYDDFVGIGIYCDMQVSPDSTFSISTILPLKPLVQ